jgi:hypothetical protein
MSLDRIGSAANTQFMLAQIQKAESALDASNRQVATGKLSDTYSGYGDKTAVMEATRAAGARTGPPPPRTACPALTSSVPWR